LLHISYSSMFLSLLLCFRLFWICFVNFRQLKALLLVVWVLHFNRWKKYTLLRWHLLDTDWIKLRLKRWHRASKGHVFPSVRFYRAWPYIQTVAYLWRNLVCRLNTCQTLFWWGKLEFLLRVDIIWNAHVSHFNIRNVVRLEI